MLLATIGLVGPLSLSASAALLSGSTPRVDDNRWPYEDIEDAIGWRRAQRWRGSLGDLIAYFCVTRGITGVELAGRLGQETSGFVSRIRNGRIPITHRTLQALSRALDLTALEERLLYGVAGDFSVVPIPPQRLGAFVASLRDCDAMTQEDLARAMGLDTSTVSRLEHGRRRADDKELKKLTEVLPSARDNPLVYFAAGRLPPDAIRRTDEIAVAEFAEYVYWLRISRESYREALELIEPNLKLIRRLPLTPVVKEHYTIEILNSYADCLLMTGQMEEAIPITQQAARGALRRSNPVQVADAQTLYASICYALDRDRDAIRGAESGIEMMESLTRQRRGGLAWSYEQLQLKRTVSLAYVAKSVDRLDQRLVMQIDPWLQRRFEHKDYAADAFGRKAELLALAGDVEGALGAWDAQQHAAAKQGTPDTVLYAFMNGAEIALLAHERADAERLIAEARRLALAEGLGYSQSNIERLERQASGDQ